MDKPLSIVIEETRQSIADAVNKSHLPPALLAYIVKDVYSELRQIEANQYKQDKIAYEISLNEEEKKENNVVVLEGGVKDGNTDAERFER